MFTSARTVLIVLAVTSALVFAPLGAHALGVGPVGVNTGAHTGVGVSGTGGGLVNTGINTNASINTNANVDTSAGASGDTAVHERVMNNTELGSDSNVDIHSNPATAISDEDLQNHKKRLSNPKVIKSTDTSAVDLDSSLSTTPAPLGVNSKSQLGEGVTARMPGASGR